MNKIRKVLSVNLQLIILFLGLGLFSVLSLILIIWYNDRVEESNDYISELEKLMIWNEGIYEFYDSDEIDRYAKPAQYRDFDHLLGDIKSRLIGDIEEAIDNEDSVSQGERLHRLNAKKDILLYSYDLWSEVKKKIDKLNAENNYIIVDQKKYRKDTAYVQTEDGGYKQVLQFKEERDKRRVLRSDSKIKLKEIHQILRNIGEQLDELLRLVRIENHLRITNYHTILWVVTILDTIIFVLAYFIVWRKVIKPLRISKKEGAQVYEKGFQIELSYQRDDEIGYLTSLINRLLQDIRKATIFIEKLRTNDTGDQFLHDVESRTPLFEELISMRNNMRDIEIKEKERSWTISGQAIFSDLLTKYNSDFESFVDIIIEKLVKYVDCLQGGLFILNDGDDFLTLTSVYAYDRKKYIDGKVEKGDGIVGQVWQERKMVYIENIPDEHVMIKSGLGEARPKSLLVVPLVEGEILYGVVELASFRKLKDYEIEFVQKIGENIATTLASVRVNEQTQKLLKESQVLTQQMREQEESMKQNLIELQGAQEELKLRDIQRENELKHNNENFTKEIDSYKLLVQKLESRIEELEQVEEKLKAIPKAPKDAVDSSQIIELEKQHEAQIADLEETIKIKELRIQKLRKKVAKLQGGDQSGE